MSTCCATPRREPKTVDGYRQIHRQWFSPSIGSLKVAEVTAERMDQLFGVMRTQVPAVAHESGEGALLAVLPVVEAQPCHPHQSDG